MKKGFTLLELMIVIIIIGVLATLGVMQYQSAIERSRGAEARQILGQLRSQCAAISMDRDETLCTNGNLGIETGGVCAADLIPGTTCCATNYFRYDVTPPAAVGGNVVFTATRCDGNTGTGKNPDATVPGTLTLTTNFPAGTDNWTSTGGY